MSDWNRAKKLIEKGFKCGYFGVCYGEIVARNGANAACGSYPYTEEETEFLLKYFKGEK